MILLSSPFITGYAEALPEELRGLHPTPRGFQLDASRYESPLVQEDGGRADSVVAWMKQRQKLRQQWMQLMGPWPELLEHSPLRMGARRVDQHFEQQVQLQASLGPVDRWLVAAARRRRAVCFRAGGVLRPGNQYWKASGQAGARLWSSVGQRGLPP